MNKFRIFLLSYFFSYTSYIYASDGWVLWWISQGRIRKGDIHTDDIPKIIVYAIEYLMWFAATISIIFIIIWGYKLAVWSLSWSTEEWKKTIILALSWFVLASVSWLILKLIIDNFS